MLISVRASLVFATQTWLAETPEQAKKAGTPSYLGIGMSGQFWTWRLLDLWGLTTRSRSHGRGGGQSTANHASEDQLLTGLQTYLPLFLPPGPDRRANGTGTEAPAAASPS